MEPERKIIAQEEMTFSQGEAFVYFSAAQNVGGKYLLQTQLSTKQDLNYQSLESWQ